MTGRRVSIKDVAREAGVSVTTVSHALNDKGRLSPATRAHVREVADRLGYLPNPAARSLVSGRTGLIAAVASLPDGFTTAFTEFGYYTALVGAASGAAVGRGTALVVAPPARAGFIWERVPLDGVIVIDPLVGDPALPSLRAARIPYVTIGDDPEGGVGPVVTADDADAARAMFDHLGTDGGRVGLLTIPPVNGFVAQTLDAYRRWCADRGHPDRTVVTDLARLIADDREHLRASVDAVLSAGADAIFAPIELIGTEVLRVLVEAGRSVPGEVRLATTDDAGRAAAADPPLTALTYDHAEMGRRAAELLLDVAQGIAGPDARVHVPAVITPRASTAVRG